MEHLSMNMERQQEEQSIQWRRDKVLELSSQGHSQRDISTKYKLVLVQSIEIYHILDNNLNKR
jgi:hypothetical protein